MDVNLTSGWLGAIKQLAEAMDSLSQAIADESITRQEKVASLEKRLSKLEKSASS